MDIQEDTADMVIQAVTDTPADILEDTQAECPAAEALCRALSRGRRLAGVIYGASTAAAQR